MKILPYFPGFALLFSVLFAEVAQAQGPTLDPTFALTSAVGNTAPTFPQIIDMVQQPDGNLIVAGNFRSINNVPALNVCRLLADGQVDVSYVAAVADDQVEDIALQSDGKLLIAGRFANVGGQLRPGLARLLANGALDPGFVPPFGITPGFTSFVRKIVLESGIGILILGTLIPSGTGSGVLSLVRLTEATGALDPTFQPGFTTFGTGDALVQPGGRLVFAGNPHLIGGQQCVVWATLPNGAIDPAFVPLPASATYRNGAALMPDPATNNFYVQAAFGRGLGAEPVRLLPNGAVDASFNPTGAFGSAPRYSDYESLAVQPNGRLLLGGDFDLGNGAYAGSWRLLPSGARDFSYQAANGPGSGVRSVLVQADGALVFGGYFSQAAGFGLNCLARMRDPNVLATGQPPAEASTLAWPVPAHDVLHLRLSAPGGPVRLTLLDALGRVARQQDAAAGQTAATLPTAGLPPGVYLLRVAYPSGPVLRRVVLE